MTSKTKEAEIERLLNQESALRKQIAPLTPRWYPLTAVAVQHQFWDCWARFQVCSAGRRSGKTELAKRKCVLAAINYDLPYGDGWFVCCAPTHQQAKRIFWNDLKALTPRWALDGRPSESELTIHLYNGASITVLGMDKPERIEGRPLDGIVMDEYANMKPETWDENVRPALSTRGRPGWALLIGVPEGRNHYYEKFKKAKTGLDKEWAAFTWKSSEVIDPKEVEQARRDMDELTFQQEYEGSFVNFTGRAYYSFGDHNISEQVRYDPKLPLIFMFDFNRSPGVACVCQEQFKSDYRRRGTMLPRELAEEFLAVVGEVWIPHGSNTLRVCDKLIQDWESHKLDVMCYGDATGGAEGTQSVAGSDWDLIEAKLRPVFGERLKIMVNRSNPRERARVNSVNSCCRTAAGEVRMLVGESTSPHLIADLEGVTVIEGGAGELDKDKDAMLTHISDAFGYYVAEERPVDDMPRASAMEAA